MALCRRERAARRLTSHFHEREEATVRAGTLGARIGKETVRVPAGGTGIFPAGVVHTWWNAGEVLLEMSGRVIPAVDLDRYLQALFAVLNAAPSGRPSIFYIAHVLWRHRHTQKIAAPPRIIQRIIFPLVLFAGRVLGKYRGTELARFARVMHGSAGSIGRVSPGNRLLGSWPTCSFRISLQT